ncbi:FBP domain-containing protein [Mycetocola reblochoni]|nr:FBP domain-containing protein [Mycetocola reblochoni]RLP68243.1 FBP domain-containing protein [Mycetocola reblochoni]
MIPLTESQIRSSFLNVSQRERAAIVMPDLAAVDADRLDYLGWRDPKLPRVGYIVVDLDGEPAGILLRQTEGTPRARAQCSWCEDVLLPNEVVQFNVRRAGAAGRNGDTVGTLICERFQCSANVRVPPREAYLGFDVEGERQRRIRVLRAHAEGFLRDIRDGSRA